MAAPEKVYKLITTGDLRLNGYHEYKPAKIRYNDKIIEYIRKDIVDEMLATAEDHAYFAGRTKTTDEIKEALLSEVLPYFMHGGEADEVVAKLDEVLNQKK